MRAPGETPQSSDVFHSVLASRVLPGPAPDTAALLSYIRYALFPFSGLNKLNSMSYLAPDFLVKGL